MSHLVFPFITLNAGLIIGLSSTLASSTSWGQSDSTLVLDVRPACCKTVVTEENLRDNTGHYPAIG